VEQQFQQAVSLVQRALAFLESVKDVAVRGTGHLESRQTDAYEDVRAQVRQRSVQLAEILRDSLSKLPNSAVRFCLHDCTCCAYLSLRFS
jgi:DNA-binding protein